MFGCVCSCISRTTSNAHMDAHQLGSQVVCITATNFAHRCRHSRIPVRKIYSSIAYAIRALSVCTVHRHEGIGTSYGYPFDDVPRSLCLYFVVTVCMYIVHVYAIRMAGYAVFSCFRCVVVSCAQLQRRIYQQKHTIACHAKQ